MNTQIDYEAQAQAFLDRFQIKFRATLSDSKVAPWSDSEHSLCGSKAEESRHHFRVTLSKDNREYYHKAGRVTFDFWASIANAEKGIKTVTPYDVLSCISVNVHCEDGFLEWCDNMGYERDSIKALQTYRRCSAFSKRLQAFFTSEEIEALCEIQ